MSRHRRHSAIVVQSKYNSCLSWRGTMIGCRTVIGPCDISDTRRRDPFISYHSRAGCLSAVSSPSACACPSHAAAPPRHYVDSAYQRRYQRWPLYRCWPRAPLSAPPSECTVLFIDNVTGGRAYAVARRLTPSTLGDTGRIYQSAISFGKLNKTVPPKQILINFFA